MSHPVIIKSSKCGITLVLNPDIPFDILLDEILKKFKESEKFFSNAKFALSFEGRDLTDEERYKVVEHITSYTSVDILCIIEENELRDLIINEKLKQLSGQYEKNGSDNNCFYRGNLLPHEHLETDESIVILGDVPQGASVVSKSDVIVLGALYGTAYAGMDGNGKAVIVAMDFCPERYNIGGIYGDLPHGIKNEKHSRFSKKNKTPKAKMAYVKDGFIITKSIYEGLELYNKIEA